MFFPALVKPMYKISFFILCFSRGINTTIINGNAWF